jgi:hypothetical protein
MEAADAESGLVLLSEIKNGEFRDVSVLNARQRVSG